MSLQRLGVSRGILILLILSIILSSTAIYLNLQAPPRLLKPTKRYIGILWVEGAILTSGDSQRVREAINVALLNQSIKAVVVAIDSPGGTVDDVESIYLDLLRLGEEKPLVASITSALSGGYYIAVAADYIYTLPTSMVGNVGVIGVGPPVLIPSERVLESGAYKVTGFSMLQFPFNLTEALRNFASAVEEQRGDRLQLSRKELLRGKVYLGCEAVRLGLADEIGALQDAIKKAAEEAHLTKYGIVNLNQLAERGRLTIETGNQTAARSWREIDVNYLRELHPPPTLYYLYLPERGFQVSEGETVETEGGEEAEGGGLVLVDLTHENKVSRWTLNVLVGELVNQRIPVGFISDWDRLESALGNASCLIVAAPTKPYGIDEGKTIEDFVSRGGLLILLYDPSTEYVSIPELNGPINSLANRFGVGFANGYLYDEENYYGFYRNIIVENFINYNLTRGVERLVLFTAASIYTKYGVAYTGNTTYSSTAERRGQYPVMAHFYYGNGTVIALGDITLLTEPYCYVEDNYRLMLNLIDLIARTRPPKAEEVEEIKEPHLPVGTVKIFIETVDGKETTVRWVKVSETEVQIERRNETTTYHYDEEGNLIGWTSEDANATYSPPLPATPYPLRRGKGWSYKSNYTLNQRGVQYHGIYIGQETVTKIEKVKAEDGRTYTCARVHFMIRCEIYTDGGNWTYTYVGDSWLSGRVGLVKEEGVKRLYIDGELFKEEERRWMLKSVEMG